MGRYRKTTEELDRKGAFDKNPKRGLARAAEPQPTEAIGPPPPDFTNPASPTALQHLQAWNEILGEAKDVRLTIADRTHVEMMARLRVRCRRPTATTSDFLALDKYASKLGLNPASRSLVGGKGAKSPTEEDEEWGQLAGGETGLRVQ